MTMLTDGIKDEEKEDAIRQLDIAELLVEAVELEAQRADTRDVAE